MARWNYQGKMPEYHIQMVLEKQAGEMGYLYFHDRSAKLNKPGFPDLHILGYGRYWVLELKKTGEEPTAIQQQWLDAYRQAGIDARCIHPDDLEPMIKELQDGFQAHVLSSGKS